MEVRGRQLTDAVVLPLENTLGIGDGQVVREEPGVVEDGE